MCKMASAVRKTTMANQSAIQLCSNRSPATVVKLQKCCGEMQDFCTPGKTRTNKEGGASAITTAGIQPVPANTQTARPNLDRDPAKPAISLQRADHPLTGYGPLRPGPGQAADDTPKRDPVVYHQHLSNRSEHRQVAKTWESLTRPRRIATRGEGHPQQR